MGERFFVSSESYTPFVYRRNITKEPITLNHSLIDSLERSVGRVFSNLEMSLKRVVVKTSFSVAHGIV